MTPAGTTPGVKSTTSSSHTTSGSATGYDSGRYTPPSHINDESPRWVPILMLGLFILGGVAIICRYLFWDSNVPMIAGMVGLLAGLYTATKWR